MVFNQEHIKQNPKHITSGVDYAPIPVNFLETKDVNGIPKIVVHPWG